MRGDFSRIRLNRQNNYTAVLDQQGRVALDADANEQCFIDEYLRRSEIVDVVGEFGAPSGDAGFGITVVNNEILIGPGRYYVAGLLCENPASCSYDDQRYLVDSATTGAELLAELTNSRGSDALQVYLEVWQRLVTELDDPCLREPALGLADTTTRLQTVWRVVADPFNPIVVKPGQTGITDCCQQMYAGASHPSTGTLSATTGGPAVDCGCEPVAAAGYQGIENQLYRAEVHIPGDQTNATFKWSRENGSVVAAITGISGSTLQLNTLGPDANLGFQAQQWVELTDDTYLFGDDPNKPGTLYQIQSIRPADLSVTLTSPVIGIDTSRNARIRRWDQSGPTAGTSGVPLAAGSTLQLENGIQIQFGAGTYRSGDYWTIPARTASGQIDWPPCAGDGNPFQPPVSTRVYRAPLACIHFSRRSGIYWEDCRRLFSPLTSRPPAIHITDISWVNDALMTADELAADGLVITLDRALASPITGANFIVTFEWPEVVNLLGDQQPVPGREEVAFALPTTIVRQIAIFDATITASGQTQLSWQLPANALTLLQNKLLSKVAAAAGVFTRVRVRLLGQTIFTGDQPQPLYLDGRAFGQLDVPTASPKQIGLQLPSGAGVVASDFDSWFYLAPTLRIESLTIAPAKVFAVIDEINDFLGVADQENESTVVPPPAATATVTVNYPTTANVTLALKADNAAYQTGIVSIPATASFGGKASCTFPIQVLANPHTSRIEQVTVVFTITASFGSTGASPSTASATFTVVGAEPHEIIH